MSIFDRVADWWTSSPDNSKPAPDPKKAPAPAPAPKKDPAPAPAPKKDPAPAPAPKKDPAPAPAPKKDPPKGDSLAEKTKLLNYEKAKGLVAQAAAAEVEGKFKLADNLYAEAAKLAPQLVYGVFYDFAGQLVSEKEAKEKFPGLQFSDPKVFIVREGKPTGNPIDKSKAEKIRRMLAAQNC